MHDRNGKPLKAGDKVMIPATVESCGDATSRYCNITLVCDEPMGKGSGTEYPYKLTLNAGMVEKIEGRESVSETASEPERKAA